MDAAEPPSLRHRLLQGAAGLVALVVLYVLSVGPATYLAVKSDTLSHPLWGFYIPLVWVADRTHLATPLSVYVSWWGKLAGYSAGH